MKATYKTPSIKVKKVWAEDMLMAASDPRLVEGSAVAGDDACLGKEYNTPSSKPGLWDDDETSQEW